MEEISPSVLLAFALVALAVIIVIAFLISRLVGRREKTVRQPDAAPHVEAAHAPPAPARASPPAASPPAQTPATAPLATTSPLPNSPPPPASPPAKPAIRSYAEISATEAPYAPRTSVIAPTAIDYSSEAPDAGLEASYTAITVAEAARRTRGPTPTAAATPAAPASSTPAPSTPAAKTENGNGSAPQPSSPAGESYTAVALATAGQAQRTSPAAPCQKRIDYSDMPIDVGPDASYTAIAIAAAAAPRAN